MVWYRDYVSVTSGPVGSQVSLREANSARVIDTVQRYGQITQVELASATGLSPATISNIVKVLQSQGIVETRNTIRSGRRAQLVTLARETGLAAGVYIGRRALHITISDATGRARTDQSLPLPIDHRVDTTLDRTALLILELTDKIGATLDELVGIGVALPAPIDPSNTKITIPGIMRDWENVDVRDVLSRRLGSEVVVDNDANVGALAESRYGALRGAANSIYARVSYQTGAGVLINHQLYRGAHGTVGEIGHIQVAPHGPICRCGARGCLNTVVGADALIDSLRFSRGDLTLRDVIALANDGDAGCRQAISDAGATLGSVLADLATWSDPQVIAIGGELAQTGDILIDPIRDAVNNRPLLTQAGIHVVPAQLGPRSEVIGGFALAMDTFGHRSSHEEMS